MVFEINDAFLENLSKLIISNNHKEITTLFSEVHFADIAEVLEEVDFDEAIYIIKLLDSEKTSEILTELDEDTREKILANLSAKEIAEEVGEMDSDDAADIIGELSEERQIRVINALEDKELAADIKELLSYEENTAGALMAKELVKVYETWTVAGCMRRIRGQAKEVTRVHSIYVVDKEDKLVGRLSLKDLIIAKSDQQIADISKAKVDAVNVHEDDEEVAKIMTKYDLEAIPVVDDNNVLLGRITIDDIVDVLKEEAEKDYQMASGISEDVESSDSIWELTRARIPWLLIGMLGGLFGAKIIGIFDLERNFELAFFIPLIAAMGGNVGIQSAAIVVQGLANDSLKMENMFQKLLKELGIGLLNGIICSLIILGATFLLGYSIELSITVSISLLAVIVFAALFGTFIPLTLKKYNIDPALATGPFITTVNDVLGLFIYFMIGQAIL